MEYYRVVVLGGHVGAGNNILLTFGIKAQNITEAMDAAKNMPAVKHYKNNVIQELTVITKAEYKKLKQKNAYAVYDPMKEN